MAKPVELSDETHGILEEVKNEYKYLTGEEPSFDDIVRNLAPEEDKNELLEEIFQDKKKRRKQTKDRKNDLFMNL